MTDEHSTIEAHLATSYLIRSIIVTIVCLVLGVWGIWDYVEIIPRQEREFARAEVCRAFNQYAEPVVSGGEAPNEKRRAEFVTAVLRSLEIEGGGAIESDIDGLREAVSSGGEHAIDTLEELLVKRLLPEAVRQAAESQGAETGSTLQTGPRSESTWLAAEAAMVRGARTPTLASGDSGDVLRQGLLLAQAQLNLYGEVEQPSAYDRPIQWLFILCLPFVPWYLWGVVVNKRKRFALDADGTLHVPGETWSPQDLADIDMKKWMSKSKAWVVHTDGHRVLMDDYIFKGVYRIVGEIASARYPAEWTDEAKRVKKDTAPPEPADSSEMPEIDA
ncbi:MAG: hypothetical protein QF471_03795 [Phycisphaerales bacterium]|jgi:hypothetical protein|nr:hypothetical protein [Phycisphaerales bacterium]